MSILSKDWLSIIAPQWSARRSRARYMQRLYDAAIPSRFQKDRPGGGLSGDRVMDHARTRLTNWARHLDENSDLAVGVLDELVNNTVGAGTTFEPAVMTGKRAMRPATDLNRQIRQIFREWYERPESTEELPGAQMERILCRSLYRDGEVFAQHLDAGPVLPYSLELIESDLLPFDWPATGAIMEPTVQGGAEIIHGVERNSFGRPLAYHFYTTHPGGMWASSYETQRISAERIVHLKLAKRIRQARGSSIFAAVMTRLADVKEYEESERIAARVAASMCAAITRSDAFGYPNEQDQDGHVPFEMSSGQIFTLNPGEAVETLGANRPNTGLQDFRNAMLRAVSAGTGAKYSSVSKDYNGTYSAQRQELVESQPAYAALRSYYHEKLLRPMWRRFIDAAVLAGRITVPRNVNRDTIYNVELRGPAMPWIDPAKEVSADQMAVEAGFESRKGVIRKRGGDPDMVDAQRASDTFQQEQQEQQQQDQANDGQDDSGQLRAAG